MAVNLSPVGGVAAQFFDNSGNVLTGGLLYSYLAGTTTPAVTYTSSNGITANSNPIVLDAAGRVPNSGEIWLTDSLSYKFILKDSNNVQIATWDNIVGINSNFVNYTLQVETQTATQGQTIFTLAAIQYQVATNSLAVYVNGSRQILGLNYIETSTTVVTFVDGLNLDDVVEFNTASSVTGNATDAQNVSYTPPGTGAVTTNVRDKLYENLSVTDFGAVGDGVADDSAAFQAAVDEAIATTGVLFVPAGQYLIGTSVVIGDPAHFTGGLLMYGTSCNSLGERAVIIQKDLNTPAFQLDSISTRLTGLSFTVWAGSNTTPAGSTITVVSTTANSITFSADPWNGSPAIIWSKTTSPYPATDGTLYTNAIRFNVGASFIGSSVTYNSGGTVTINNVKGSDGTLNAAVTTTTGKQPLFISLAYSCDASSITNANTGSIYCDLREASFFDNLWFYQVYSAFTHDATGGGGGPTIGTGNTGNITQVIVDQAQYFIKALGTINGLQLTNSQMYGVGMTFYAPYGDLSGISMSNCFQNYGQFMQANGDISSCVITGNEFNGSPSGAGYSNLMVSWGNAMISCTWTGNNFGRSQNTCFNGKDIESTSFIGNNILSNGEGTTDYFFQLSGTLTRSRFSDNNWALYGSSTSRRLGFSSTTASLSNSVFGDDFWFYSNNEGLQWIPVTVFTNGWSNTGGGTKSVSYRKDNYGTVYLRGSVSGGTATTDMFTLPSGYTPAIATATRLVSCTSSGPALLNISSGGVVSSGSATNSFVSLDGVIFATN